MSKEIVLVKVNGGFKPATDRDIEQAEYWKIGKALKCELTEWSARSLKFHKRYWGGLLELTISYWEPDYGMTTDAEQKLIEQFCKVLDDNGGGGTVAEWGKDFLTSLGQKRASKTQVSHKSKSDLHDWIKEQIGHYEVVITPSGPKRKLKPTNFNAMSEPEFRDFYKKAFNVCWRYVLAKSFKSEQEAEQAALQLLSLE